jgi:hypothetical protein
VRLFDENDGAAVATGSRLMTLDEGATGVDDGSRFIVVDDV